jgi:hypothetical protein
MMYIWSVNDDVQTVAISTAIGRTFVQRVIRVTETGHSSDPHSLAVNPTTTQNSRLKEKVLQPDQYGVQAQYLISGSANM